MSEKSQKQANPLWTKNFTIITAGSIVSMLGSSLAGFAMSLLVLDYTGSTFLYALYNFFYILPSVVMPLVSGPFLDRFSRRKTIYTLDFVTAGVYVVLAFILKSGLFNFAVLAVGCFVIGAIESVYFVAYESFYPLLISEGNYSKAYSVASTLETLTVVMVPVSAFVYNKVGIVPLFLINSLSYLAAAIMETRIKADENYIQTQKENRQKDDSGKSRPAKQFWYDFKEGMNYLLSEKGLLAIAIYFTFSSFSGAASGAVTLPYFKKTFPNGEYIYMLVWGMLDIGRAIGGAIHYKLKMPTEKKFAIAFTVYITISVLDGCYLYFPIAVMMIFCFLNGILGVTSYNIRISATQRYVPDEKKGRFNGTFSMLMTVGTLVGQLLSGALAEIIGERLVITIFFAITALSAVMFIGSRRKEVARIYNTNG